MNKSAEDMRLKAFTLMDVLAGMVIMSIVMVLVFGIVNDVNKQSHDFQSMQIELNDYKVLNANLQREVDMADQIFEVPNGFVLESELHTISYELKAEELIRKTDHGADVLHPRVRAIEFDFLQSESTQKLISGIIVKSNYRDIEMKSYFSKDYGLSEPINQLLLNVN